MNNIMKEKLEVFFPKIEYKQKWTFLVCIITMVITHLYMFTNKIFNHDDVNRMLVGDTSEAKIQHGRWAGNIFDYVSGSSVSIPYVMGVISVFAFAGTAVVLVSLFRLKKKISMVLTCGLLCTFPVAANIFLYSYVADIYFVSMFLAVWGVWLLVQEQKIANGLGIVILTLACGCYQAFWCLGMAFLFLYFLLEFLEFQTDWKNYGIKIVKSLIGAVLSLILYLIVNIIVQKVSGYGATDYQGLNTMGQFGSIGAFFRVLIYTCYEFVQFFYLKGNFTGDFIYIIVNIILTAVVVYLMFRGVKIQKQTASYWIVFLLWIVLLPFASNLVSIVSMNKTHILMQYGFVIPYILCVILLERIEFKKAILSVISYLLLLLIIYNGYITDNEIYYRQQLNYEATYSYTIRLLSRIEEMEGYSPSIPIALMNEKPQTNDKITIMLENYPEEMDYFKYLDDMVGTEPHTFVKKANDISDFCKYYHGYDLQLVDMERLPELAATQDFQNMPTYPQEGSMQYIDGALVIKLPSAE